MSAEAAPVTTVAPPIPQAASTSRLVSLDVFRGATIAAMLLVNDPGSWSAVYPPLLHAEWHGWTPTDLIFPFFLFIVGITTYLSLGARRARGASDRELILQAVRRGSIIILLGLMLMVFPFYSWGTLEGNPDPTFIDRVVYRFEHIRIPGVLQRIGLAYMIGAILWLKTSRRAQIWITAGLLFGYWFLMMFVPAPGSGMMGFDAIAEPSRPISAWLDRLVLGEKHLWSGTKTWDPEGILSTIPAIATVMLGIFAGSIIGAKRSLEERLVELFGWGVLWTIAGTVWSWFFPINKGLWSSSFALFTAGLGALALGACIWLVDIRKSRSWTTPFVVYGVNPILAYVGAGLMARLIYSVIRVPFEGKTVSLQSWIYQTLYTPWLPPKMASLAFALSFVLVWLAILWPFYKKGIYLKV
jgi:predicted acyltransferase